MDTKLKALLHETLTRSHDALDLEGLETQYVRESLAALEAAPVDDIQAMYEQARTAMLAVKSDAYAFKTTQEASHDGLVWWVSCMVGDRCHGSYAKTFGEALVMNITKLTKLASEPKTCPTCGKAHT